jgi:hypothetical protein
MLNAEQTDKTVSQAAVFVLQQKLFSKERTFAAADSAVLLATENRYKIASQPADILFLYSRGKVPL